MTQYCIDLMIEQIRAGHEVSLMWPGVIYSQSSHVSIKKRGFHTLSDVAACKSIEIRNPLPVPLMDGISDPGLFTAPKDKSVFDRYFENNACDILHVHTFMGMPRELVCSARDHGVKVFFTSHDYFPLCPRGNLYHGGINCWYGSDCSDCTECNSKALSFRKMCILQSDIYKTVKDFSLVQKLRKKHNQAMYAEDSYQKSADIMLDHRENYRKLREYYLGILNMCDRILFNSSITLQGYRNNGFSGSNAAVLSISNGAIQNHKTIRQVPGIVRIGYLNPIVTHKGYNLLRDACDLIWQSGQHNFEVHYFAAAEERPYARIHSPYQYSELPKVMSSFDLLVTPSTCAETFGFTVLEALSYGVPVIVSEFVGAKDLIENGKNGYVVSADPAALSMRLRELIENPWMINDMNQYIVEQMTIRTMKDHGSEIEKLYKEG